MTDSHSHAAADPLSLRFPGGRLRPEDWTALAQVAGGFGSDVHLSVRGTVQILGVQDVASHREQVVAAGLAPGAAHHRVRSILSSPLAGRLTARHDLGDLPHRLEELLLGRADVEELSSDFVFGFDDGSGDVLAHRPDLAAVAEVPDQSSLERSGALHLRLHVRGRDTGLRTSMADAATVLMDAAAALGASADRSDGVGVGGGVDDDVVVVLSNHPRTSPAPTGDSGTDRSDISISVEVPTVGWVDTTDGLVTLLAVVADGVVPARLAEFLGAIDRPSTISADRVIGVHGLTEGMAEQVVRVLAPMGMIFDATSTWAPTRR